DIQQAHVFMLVSTAFNFHGPDMNSSGVSTAAPESEQQIAGRRRGIDHRNRAAAIDIERDAQVSKLTADKIIVDRLIVDADEPYRRNEEVNAIEIHVGTAAILRFFTRLKASPGEMRERDILQLIAAGPGARRVSEQHAVGRNVAPIEQN